MYYAYSRNLPVQIIMTRGAERIVNETKLAINFGERVYFRVRQPFTHSLTHSLPLALSFSLSLAIAVWACGSTGWIE